MDAIIISIVGWIITILIAVYAARSGSKDTAKKLAALEESTTRQVESVKELATIQTKLAALQFEKEAGEARFRLRQKTDETWKSIENDERLSGVPLNEFTSMMYQRRERDSNLSLEQEFYSKQLSSLDGYCERVRVILKELDKD